MCVCGDDSCKHHPNLSPLYKHCGLRLLSSESSPLSSEREGKKLQLKLKQGKFFDNTKSWEGNVMWTMSN